MADSPMVVSLHFAALTIRGGERVAYVNAALISSHLMTIEQAEGMWNALVKTAERKRRQFDKINGEASGDS